MKPINIRLIVLLFLILTLIAGVILYQEMRQQNGLQVKEPLKAKAATRLTFAYYGGVSNEEMKALVESFNQSNLDGITVELMEVPKADYSRFINMHMIAGTGPDILSVDSDWKTTYFLKNWLADITKELESDRLPSYNDWAIKYGSFNGVTYSVPHAFSTSRLIYNKELFHSSGLDSNNPPATLDDLSRFAQQISQVQLGFQRYGFAWPLADQKIGFVQNMEVPLTYSGLSVFNYTTGSYDLSGYASWIGKMIDLKKNGGMLPGEMSLEYHSALTQFAKGNVGMMIVNSNDVHMLEHELDVQFEWGVAMPPALDKESIGKSPLMLLPEPMVGINNASAKKEQALKFWRYLQSIDTLKRLYDKHIILPYSNDIRKETQEAVSGQTNFSMFYPSKEEAFYPPQPVMLNNKLDPNLSIFLDIDWSSRLQAYTESFSERMKAIEALDLETKRLNFLLQKEIQTGHILIRSYMTDQYQAP